MDLRHVMCLLLLISRIGDVGTTYLATPTMVLEANPIARKLGWRFAVLSLGLCILPYFSLDVAAAVAVPFMLVSASNAAKVWVMRAMGEQDYLKLHLELARKSKRSHALLGVAASCSFVILAGVTILAFYPEPAAGTAFWIGFGVVLYGTAMWLYGSLWFRRLYRQAAAAAGE
jgi:hypothetical protein